MIKQTEVSNNSSDLCNYCIGCSLCLITLALISGYLAYIVFGIIFLIQDYDISNDCKNSNNESRLWEYVLVSVILSSSHIKIQINNDNDNIIYSVITLIGIMNLILSIWGSIELWSLSCDDLNDSNLWKIGFVSFILQVIVSIICLVLTPIILYYYIINNIVLQKENTSDNPLQEELPV